MNTKYLQNSLNIFCRANIIAKDLFLYTDKKAQYATDKNLKKQNFKVAIDQIEAALNGEDVAPTEVNDTKQYIFIRKQYFAKFLLCSHDL